MKPPSPHATRTRWRGTALLVAFALGAAVLEARILYLQLVDREFLTEQARDRHLRTVRIAAHRGPILDRRGEPLAVSTPVDSIYADPAALRDSLDRLPELAAALGQEPEALARRITSNLEQRFVWLQRHLAPSQSERVLRLDLPGIDVQREYRRFYPAVAVTGHLLGFTDIDDKGQEGLERAYDHWLGGQSGSKRVMQDRHGRVMNDVELISAARPGRELKVSIDLRLQYLAMRELLLGVSQAKASAGSVVILDPATGEVLAMVNEPSFNPNDRAQRNPDDYRNRAASDIFEPGSSFKPFVLAAAVESGRYTPATIVDTSPGMLKVGSQIVTEDPQNYGRIPLATVLAQSSNVGAALVALSLDVDAVGSQLAAFGFGQVTGSEFPSESAGIFRDTRYWSQTSRVTIAYGYGVSVTAVQLARAYGAIAAGGILRPVSLLALEEPPAGVRVLSPESARASIAMLEAVVAPPGTGQRAAVRNYRVAGKTGTARKSQSGGYAEDRHMAVFAGLAPASAPRLVVVVVIDEPKSAAFHGGDVAAPVFGRIVEEAMRTLNVPPDALAPAPLPAIQSRVAR